MPEIAIVEIPEFDPNAIEDKFVKPYFRFERPDIFRLARVLRIPNDITTRSGHYVATSIAIGGLCILSRRLAYPNRFSDSENIFERSPAALSEICNFVASNIQQNHGHLLENIDNLLWLNRAKLELYAQAVAEKEGAVQNCWAVLDGTARPICRPTDDQEEYYSGHKRFHCMKYQSLLCPDGISVSLLGAIPGRRHDAFIFGQSGLYNQLDENTRFEDGDFVIYGDQAYGIRELLLCPYPGQALNEAQQNFNLTMSRVRPAVEWGFQKILTESAFLDFKKNQKLLLQDIELNRVVVRNENKLLTGTVSKADDLLRSFMVIADVKKEGKML
ncbi:hypothetical protein JTB14_028482 [Gonioctena quinquepunctata]|nr:hypothetical protein JTB14_028482 [Gonioctena quinquepunctata]